MSTTLPIPSFYSKILDNYSKKYQSRSPFREIVEATKRKAVENFERINEKLNISEKPDKVRVAVRIIDVIDEVKAGIFEKDYDTKIIKEMTEKVTPIAAARTMQAFFRDEKIDYRISRGVGCTSIYKPLLSIEILYLWKRSFI